jgi:hypothetical protein
LVDGGAANILRSKLESNISRIKDINSVSFFKKIIKKKKEEKKK